MGIEGPSPGYIRTYLFSQAFSLEVMGRDTENDNHLMWEVSGGRCGCVFVFYIQGLSFSHGWFRNPILAVFTTSSNNTINTVIALWLYFSVIDLCSFSLLLMCAPADLCPEGLPKVGVHRAGSAGLWTDCCWGLCFMIAPYLNREMLYRMPGNPASHVYCCFCVGPRVKYGSPKETFSHHNQQFEELAETSCEIL